MKKAARFICLSAAILLFMISGVLGQDGGIQQNNKPMIQQDPRMVSGKSIGPGDNIECPPGATFSQPSANFTNAYTSSNSSGGFIYTVYSPFGGVPQPIGGQLRWWGLSLTWAGGWAPCTTDPMTFNVKFYQDNAGLPGTEVASFVATVNHTDIGELLAGWPLWQWTWTMPSSVNHASGWVSIQSESPDNCNFLWCDAPDYPANPGLQWDGSAFTNIDPVGFCLSSGIQAVMDVGVSSILSPVSGMVMGNEVVIIRVMNYGTSPISATIPVFFTMNGGMPFSGFISGSLEPGGYFDYEFDATLNLSAYGNYDFHACTQMTGDMNAANDCADKMVINSPPAYCTPVYTTGCSWGDGLIHFEVGSIVNPSGCENTLGPGWSQWFNLGPAYFEPGGTYNFKMEGGYTDTYVSIWIDWDQNFIFEADEMILNGFNLQAGPGTQYVVPVLIPGSTISYLGYHRMRVRTNWQEPAPDPCATYTFGECEEYMAMISSCAGTIKGHVYKYGESSPVAGATLDLDMGTYTTITNISGYYEFLIVYPGTHTLTVSKPGYFSQTIPGIVICGNTVIADFSLQWSEIAVNPSSLTVIVPPDTQYDSYVTITNDGPHSLGYNSSLLYITDQIGYGEENFDGLIDNPAYGDPFADVSPRTMTNNLVPEATGDILVDLDVQATNGDSQCLGGETDGIYFYVSGAGSGSDPNKLYKHDLNGTLISTTNQPAGATGWGIRDLAFDGTFIYGGCENGFFKFDPSSGTFITLFTDIGTLGCLRACAYNPTDNMFYTGNFSGSFAKFTSSGVITYITNPGLFAVYGLAYDDLNDEMFVFDQSGIPTSTFYGWDYHTNTLTGNNLQVPLLTGQTGQIAGGAFFNRYLLPGYVVLGGVAQGTSSDHLFCMEFISMESWLTISSNGSGSVPGYAEGSLNLGLQFDATGLPEGTVKTAELHITSDALTNPDPVIPITLKVMSGAELDLKAYLKGPFNPVTGQMETTLNANSFLPLEQPYGPVLPYYGNPDPYWYYPGTESVSGLSPSVVDWVLVEVRDAATATTATGAATEDVFPALLMSDGMIRDLDGLSLPKTTAKINEGCFVVISHRNHLPVMNPVPLVKTGNVYVWDFTTGAGQAYGGGLGQHELSPGKWGMIGADGNADGNINSADKMDAWMVDASQSGYLGGDFNMDGECNNADKIGCYYPAAGSASQVPE